MAAQSRLALSTRDQELLGYAWLCMPGEPKIDLDKFALLGNYKTKASASVTYGNLRKKIKNNTALSTHDQKLMGWAWRCIGGPEPKIDYGKFAELGKFKTTASASVTYGNLKKKIKQLGDGDAASAPSTQRRPPASVPLPRRLPKARLRRLGTILRTLCAAMKNRPSRSGRQRLRPRPPRRARTSRTPMTRMTSTPTSLSNVRRSTPLRGSSRPMMAGPRTAPRLPCPAPRLPCPAP
ncbi:hypothetical protein M011DRAFT_8840 [Sporormia fimetaria CBS 119925]|uniref:Uncharacterized protein n=1 Tax=Sporormia fimetaria CBS 119925 TaxID=1340428 RepID=A0A6A6VQL4_9PLEO|nr:hypothetical protein M011DRAFT_8840 [Sporormia fimetaria CBS 119925]